MSTSTVAIQLNLSASVEERRSSKDGSYFKATIDGREGTWQATLRSAVINALMTGERNIGVIPVADSPFSNSLEIMEVV